MYDIWLGIKYFWSGQGEVVAREEPKKTSTNPYEAAAAKLKQAHLEKAKKWIRVYLCEVDANV